MRHIYDVKLRVSAPSEHDLQDHEVRDIIKDAIEAAWERATWRPHTRLEVEGSIDVGVHGTDLADVPETAEQIEADADDYDYRHRHDDRGWRPDPEGE